MILASEQPTSFITALMNPDCYDHPVKKLQLIETHISWVILTGTYAYKIKKPVNFGFLDFSTLEKRQFYCEEELRLNRRLAPAIYLAVVAITGTSEQPILSGEGNAFEYAVKMLQFDPKAQLDQMLARGELQASQLDAVVRLIADFHQHIAIAGSDTDFGDPNHVYQPVTENFTQIHQHIPDPQYLKPLGALQRWSESSFNQLKTILVQRKAGGYIRECHGDMHLRNLAWYNNAPLVFDCIEFNPNLRWIDVINEIAFFVMDLQDRQQPQLAQRCLNTYLESTGDYKGTAVLPFYMTYRAVVLAKVHAIRAQQTTASSQQQADAKRDFDNYIQLALSYTRPGKPRLIITYGLSGSGKSTISQPLLEQLGAIRIRSDVERKRLFGIQAEADAGGAYGDGIYSAAATQRTYHKLAELAATVLDAGYPVIIDAAFLRIEQREPFRKLAADKQLPYVILEFTTPVETLRQRIRERKGDISDANLAVLEQQFSVRQILQGNEQTHAIKVDTGSTVDIEAIVDRIKAGNHE